MISLSQFANATHQLSQRHRREQHRRALIGFRLLFGRGNRQIGPVPRYRQHHAVVESHQHPRALIAPKDATDPTTVTAGRTLFRHDGERSSTECNIWCSLSLG